MPNPSQTRRTKGLLRHCIDQAMLIDILRYAVAAARHWWFTRIQQRMQTLRGSDSVAENTVMHNLRGLKDFAVNRSHLLVRPLSVIETIPVDARLLCIGPRSEGELLSLIGHGFVWDRVEGLDLISYSPKVKLGDMHAIPHGADRFDTVMMGWVLAYSEDPYQAAREAVRVTRNGGVIAVGVEYSPQSQEEVIADAGYLPGAKHRITSCDEILGYFGGSVAHVYYKHIVAPGDLHAVGALCVIFSIQK